MNVIIIYNTEPDTRILCGLDVFYLLFNFKFIGIIFISRPEQKAMILART